LLITFYCSIGKYFLTNINLFVGREEGNDIIMISPYFFDIKSEWYLFTAFRHPICSEKTSSCYFIELPLHLPILWPPNHSVFMFPALCTNDKECPLTTLGHKASFHSSTEMQTSTEMQMSSCPKAEQPLHDH